MGRFEVIRVQVDIAGPQAYTYDAHITTRTGRPSEMIAVTVGELVVYLYDLAAVRAFAAAWRSALGFVPPGLPEHARSAVAVGRETGQVGMLLRVEGAPARQKINGIVASASPNGVPHVRVELGRLSIHAYDVRALRTSAGAWNAIERTAERLWPSLDSFAEAEDRERTRIARTGCPAPTTSSRRRR